MVSNIVPTLLTSPTYKKKGVSTWFIKDELLY